MPTSSPSPDPRMDVKKVLYISQEIDPYLPSTAMGTFGRELTQGLQESGAEVRTFMPKFGAINERRNQLHEVIRLSGLNISIDDTDHPLIIKVATLQPSRLQVYFIDNDDYFFHHTPGQELETITDAEHNDERSIFFVRGVIETVKKLRWDPNIVHCTGWVTGLVPLYIKAAYADDPTFSTSKVVYSLYNQPFEGDMDARFADKLKQQGFSDDDIKLVTDADGHFDYIALNKLAMDYSDAIVDSTPGTPAELIDYAKASGKPFLPYEKASEGPAEYFEFYKSL